MKCFPRKHEGLSLNPSTPVKARRSGRQLRNPSAACRVAPHPWGLLTALMNPKSRKDPVSTKQVESLEEDARC